MNDLKSKNNVIDILEMQSINMSDQEEWVLTEYFRDFLMGENTSGLEKAHFNTNKVPELVEQGLSGFTIEIKAHKDDSGKNDALSIGTQEGVRSNSAWEVRCKKHCEVSALITCYAEDD